MSKQVPGEASPKTVRTELFHGRYKQQKEVDSHSEARRSENQLFEHQLAMLQHQRCGGGRRIIRKKGGGG